MTYEVKKEKENEEDDDEDGVGEVKEEEKEEDEEDKKEEKAVMEKRKGGGRGEEGDRVNLLTLSPLQPSCGIIDALNPSTALVVSLKITIGTRKVITIYGIHNTLVCSFIEPLLFICI